jgi:hypothetical protein
MTNSLGALIIRLLWRNWKIWRPPTYVAPAMKDLEFGRHPKSFVGTEGGTKDLWMAYVILSHFSIFELQQHRTSTIVVIASTEESIRFNDNDLLSPYYHTPSK